MGRRRKNPKHKQTKPKWYQKENDWGNFVFDWQLGLEGSTWREIFAVLILIISFVMIFGLFGAAGSFGDALIRLARKVFGTLGSFAAVGTMLYVGIILLVPPKGKNKYRISRFLGIILFLIAFPALAHLFVPVQDARETAQVGRGGGLVGYQISTILRNQIGLFVSFLASVIFVVVSLLMIFNFSFSKYLGLEKDEDDGDEDKEDLKIANQPAKVSVFQSVWRKMGSLGKNRKSDLRDAKAPVLEVDSSGPQMVKTDRTWEYPSIDMLRSIHEEPNPGDMQANVSTIRKCLDTFGIKITTGVVNVGPTVTQYTFKPEEGVKLNQIVARQTDLALALSAKSLRMEAPIPGKNFVGIEIPNVVPAKVTLREVLKSKNLKALKSKLALALGRDVSGEATAIDLERLPHLLIAGSTGSGKSVCINAIICSLLFNNSPKDLRFILVDPKRVELTCYNGIPHLLTPVVTEVDQTVSALKWAVSEMDRRYKLFSDLGKRNIAAYNEDPGPDGKMPYIVIVIDELADLMSTSSKEVEGSIVRLAQMARATGMHLVIATQRPSVDVLTGLIKANISSRVAFATASQVDSRTILDISGAEKLLGNGDMLFLGNGLNKPKRIQGCFVTDGEIEELNKFLRDKGVAEYDESILTFRSGHGAGTNMGGEGAGEDDLFRPAVEEVVRAGKASASLLQRRLRVGYARAARLLDILEEQGIIGPADGAKPRDVLLSDVNSITGNASSTGVPYSHSDNFDLKQEDDYDEDEHKDY